VSEALQLSSIQETIAVESKAILPSQHAPRGQPQLDLQPLALSLTAMRAKLVENTHISTARAQLALAEAVTIQAVRVYWAAIAGSLSLPLFPPPREAHLLPEAIASAATQLGEAASQLHVSHAAYHLSLIYTSLMPPQWRAARGIYYTPLLVFVEVVATDGAITTDRKYSLLRIELKPTRSNIRQEAMLQCV
jgi:hypothetical protein